MTRKRLPIGIQSFAKIREDDYYYVDKTFFVARLAEGGSYYFLSRPRRFGKSLFLDTLGEAFAGNRKLFAGLYLEDHWDWDRIHPVIRISFAAGKLESRAELDENILDQLAANAQRLGVLCDKDRNVSHCFGQLIERAALKFGRRTVVLVDEYDKPILDNLTAPDIARDMREGLRNLYSVIKGQDPHLRFVFLTGVSKFSKVSIFSGLNNLSDITLDARYAAICGYTEADLDTVFAPELPGLEREEIRRWYDGYRWLGEGVYNPFDVLLLFQEREFRAWWFETGTPTFLIDWLKTRQYFTPNLEEMFADELLLSTFDVDHIRIEAMLWQTGYVSIVESQRKGARTFYTLRVPNAEVRAALNTLLLEAWHPKADALPVMAMELYDMLACGEANGLHSHFERLYAAIPNDWYRNNPIAQYEGYFASVFYSHLAALGLDLTGEDVSSHGRCDLAIRMGSLVYVLEFKVIDGDTPTGEALAQLKARDYAAKYRAPGVRIIEVGIEFSKAKRQIVGWEVA